MLFDYIRTDAPANKKTGRLSEMTELLVLYLSRVFGCRRNKVVHQRAHQMESPGSISDILVFENLIEITSVFIVPAKLIPLTGGKYNSPSS